MRVHRILVATIVLTLIAVSVPAQTPGGDLTPNQMAVACAPAPLLAPPPSADVPRIIGSQDPVPRKLFGQPELLVVNAGTDAGMQLGQQYFVRRLVRHGAAYRDMTFPRSMRTTGWVRVVAANDTTALVTVDHVCGDILQGDFLVPFAPPALPDDITAVDTTGEPDFASLGRVLFGDDERRSAGTGEYVVIDRGSEHGVTPGARFAIYRDIQSKYFGMYPGRDVSLEGLPLVSIGEAIVVSIGPRMSLVRINQARDAIFSGDFVAPRTK